MSVRGALSSSMYTRMTAAGPERACLRPWRGELLADLRGRMVEIATLEEASMRKAMPLVRPTVRGLARTPL